MIKFSIFLILIFGSCQIIKKDNTQNYMLDIAKAVTKTNLQRLFPNAHFERDSIVVEKDFSRDFLRQVFQEKVRHFLTVSGHIEASTQDFYAKISWHKNSGIETVKINLTYYTK
jgi:hypothetical protein